MSVRLLCGLDDLIVRGIEPSIADVLPDGVMKKKHVLADDADVVAQ